MHFFERKGEHQGANSYAVVGSGPRPTPRLYGKAGCSLEFACNDGSRASGYPPDLKPFRRCWSTADCDRAAKTWTFSRRSCPSTLG